MRSTFWIRCLPAALLLVLLASQVQAASIVFEGLKRVDSSLLDDQVSLYTFQATDTAGQERESAELVRTLYATGFFDNVTIERRGEQVVVTVSERPMVDAVEHSGIEELKEEDRDKAIRVHVGEFFDAQRIVDTRNALREAYIKEGIQDATIRISTVPNSEGDVTIKIDVEEHDKVYIRSVRIMGNTHFTDEEILGKLQSSPRNMISWLTSKGTYDPVAVDVDVQRLDAAYQEQGYLKVQIQPPVVTWSEDRRWVDIVFGVIQNKRYKLGRVTYSGDLIFSQPLLRDQLDLEEGDWANRLKIEQTVQSVTDLYGDLGFAFARVGPDFEFDEVRNIAHLKYEIVRGKPVFFRLINVRGNTKTRDKVIRREMLVQEGQLYNGQRLRQSRERIFALGFFEDVSVTTRAFGPEQMDLTVLVREKSTGTISAGLGFSSVDSFVGTLKLNFGNLLGYGIRLDLNGEVGGRRKNVSISYLDPYFLDTKVSFGIDLYYTQQEYYLNALADEDQSYEQMRVGGQLTLGYLIGLYTRAYVGYRYDYVSLSSEAFNAEIFSQGGRTSALQFTLRRDSKNHVYDPTGGNINMVRAEVAGDPLGGDFVFEKYTGLTQWFYTPFWKFTFMLRGEVGLATSRSGERIPFSERYFLGGIYSVRGYQSRSIGPQRSFLLDPAQPQGSSQVLVVGGNKQIFANAEMSFPIIPPAGIKGVVFFDAGNAWLEEQRYFATPLEFGYGFGIRWFSPIGPLRFEWGYPLFPETGQRKSVFEFTIGTFF